MERIYKLYFRITSRRPFGSIDWAIRRFLGVVFNNASSKADLNMIQLLSMHRNDACKALREPAPLAAGVPNINVYAADAGQDLHQLVGAGEAPYILLTRAATAPSRDSLTAIIQVCEASPPHIALWELAPTLGQRVEYVDPITLEIPYSPMRSVILRRAAIDASGGFDTSLPQEAQAIDMAYRLRAGGFSLVSLNRGKLEAEDSDALAITADRTPYRTRWLLRLKYSTCGRPIFNLLYRRRQEGQSPAQGGPSHLWRRGYEIGFGERTASRAIPDNKRPLISLIIRTYSGRWKLLQQAIHSAINQTYPNLEILVVEDGSDNFSGEIENINSNLDNNRVSLLHVSQTKLGRSHAGNLGLSTATGQFIGFLDDDDLLFPHHLETLYAGIASQNQNGAAYALSWESHTRYEANMDGIDSHLEVPRHLKGSFSREKLKRLNFLPIQSVLFARSLYDQCGGFDVDKDLLEDWDLWLRYSSQSDFTHVPLVTSLYRIPADPYERVARLLGHKSAV
ncbi:MAG: glycosyltransferase [Halioglobus sp.]